MLTATEAHALKYDKFKFVEAMIDENIRKFRLEYQLNTSPSRIPDVVYIPKYFLDDSDFVRKIESMGYIILPPDKMSPHRNCARIMF